MHKHPLRGVAVAAALCLALTACGDDAGDSAEGTPAAPPPAPGEPAEPTEEAVDGTVGVILPDATTSPRWEANDRPLLQAAFEAAGVDADIQNANGDVAAFGTICDGMINAGVNVLLVTNLDSDSGSACLSKAQAAGVATIDYDRLTLGGGASYYVSFDNVEVGRLIGAGLGKCLADAGTTDANVVYINGDPTDNNAALFKQGYVESVSALVDAGSVTIVGDQTGEWDADVAGTAFEQLYTQNGGDIDGVVSANDTMAGGIIARLKAQGLNGSVPVTGQDASLEALQAILAGDQCMTVYKAIQKEADAASALAIALIKGEDGSSIATDTVTDTVLGTEVPSSLQTPVPIYRENVKDVVDDGFWTAAEVCAGAAAAACTELGIS